MRSSPWTPTTSPSSFGASRTSSTGLRTWWWTRCGGVPAAAAARVLGSGGRLVNLGSSAGETSPLTSAVLRSKSLRVLGYTNNELTPDQRAAAISHIARLATQGQLTVTHQVVTFDEVATGWKAQSSGAVGGRVVLEPKLASSQ